MEWTELVIKVSSKDAEMVSDILQMASPAGIYIEDYSDMDAEMENFGPIEIIDEELLNMDRENALVHMYIEPDENPEEAVIFVTERFSAENIEAEIQLKPIKEEDWANNWKQYFKPIEIGKKLVIKPTWESYDNTEGRIILEIDPSMSFGSGQHETTQLCMGFLEGYVDENTQMLDVGTGSGILSVEALLLGAKSVTAVDIDPLSVRVAKENAVLNKVDDKFTVFKADLTNGVVGKYNLITANIVADIIIRLLDDIERIITEDGILIASGIISTREEDVKEALKNIGYEVLETKYERDWVALSAKKIK